MAYSKLTSQAAIYSAGIEGQVAGAAVPGVGGFDRASQGGRDAGRASSPSELWPDTQVDFERGVNKAINRLREALGDDADNPRFIETVPQRGYRFLVPVETAQPEQALPPSAESSRAPGLTNRRGLFAVAGGVFAVPLGTVLYLRGRTSPPGTLAVFPLENLSGDQAQEYFADGMTDELISEIGRTVSVHVISRTSVMRYKRAARKSLREIAGELTADVILEGAVAQLGNKVRINLRLIRAEDDRQLWSDKYERDLTEVLALQSEAALRRGA